ncbi:MAG: universal stress protein [Candidatus Binatia bacterium]
MFKKILVPLDRSSAAEKVLPFARKLAGALKAPVELLEVIDISAMSAHMVADKARFLARLIVKAEDASLQYLDEIARSFSGLVVNCSRERGRPAEVILDKAAAPGTLIAMATHGRSGINRWLLGSVAEKVLRGTNHPLFLVRGDDDDEKEHPAVLSSIIVPLDGSPLAESVLPTVVELAKVLDASVLLFRAFELPAKAYYGREDYLPDYDALKNRVRDEAQGYLDEQVAALKAQGLERVSALLREGLGAEEIIRWAKEHPDSLVAMCTHGRSGVKRWVLGSVTEKVVRLSGDPVLVMRGSREARRWRSMRPRSTPFDDRN